MKVVKGGKITHYFDDFEDHFSTIMITIRVMIFRVINLDVR